MRTTEITARRHIMVVLEHGEDFYTGLAEACAKHDIRSGYIPSFVGGFRRARLVGDCKPLKNPDAPLWEEVEVEHLEALGGGTLAWNAEENQLAPHIHVAAGIKDASADGRVSHLLGATVQFICEIPVVEVIGATDGPALTRSRDPHLFAGEVPILGFGPHN
ncbi:PCC domain-containing protein [Streptomyces longwoodensis]|uniref:PPC domain-containing DNA-binding protein n=1 Tax=Streptomyces longwoodensis TaxID=68231 RepID=UPI0036E08D0E